MMEPALRRRVDDLMQRWHVIVDRTLDTESSFLGFGTRDHQPVVLKVARHEGDEWHSGEVLQAFRGKGVVRVYESMEGAVLLERAIPGNALVDMVTGGQDDEATAILAGVIEQMAGATPPEQCPTVFDWSEGFERYLATSDQQISRDLVAEAAGRYTELAASQRQTTLLHGDLNHYNVLRDAKRGWLAIDPKGVVGEVEYEIGAMLRNPVESPNVFTSPNRIESRLQHFVRTLNLDMERALWWAFAQAILSAVWDIEDGFTVHADSPAITLAHTLRAMVV